MREPTSRTRRLRKAHKKSKLKTRIKEITSHTLLGDRAASDSFVNCASKSPYWGHRMVSLTHWSPSPLRRLRNPITLNSNKSRKTDKRTGSLDNNGIQKMNRHSQLDSTMAARVDVAHTDTLTYTSTQCWCWCCAASSKCVSYVNGICTQGKLIRAENAFPLYK